MANYFESDRFGDMFNNNSKNSEEKKLEEQEEKERKKEEQKILTNLSNIEGVADELGIETDFYDMEDSNIAELYSKDKEGKIGTKTNRPLGIARNENSDTLDSKTPPKTKNINSKLRIAR